MSQEQAIEHIRNSYARVATSGLNNESQAVRAVASAFGYSDEELAVLPSEANMALSCGNPLALAGVRDGETVLDLGCGGGMDVFLAARKVGPQGMAIGVDMTPEMLDRARRGQQELGLANVEFHQAALDQLPIETNSVDCVISNCVINLVPDKLAAFKEAMRVLKPGGRIAISDIALKQSLPDAVRTSLDALVGCISGALQIADYRSLLERAGFESIVITDTAADLNAYAMAGTECCSSQPDTATSCGSSPVPSLHDGLADVMKSINANDYAASVRVHAIKPQHSTPDENDLTTHREKLMKTIQVFDKPMCCSTGVCGPQVDPVLPTFAADLDWLKAQGHRVERSNLAQQPAAFIENKTVHKLISTEGTDCLPVILVDGEIVSRTSYPTRNTMASWIQEAVTSPSLPIAQPTDECCGDTGCC